MLAPPVFILNWYLSLVYWHTSLELPESPTLVLSGPILLQWPTLSTVRSPKLTPRDVSSTVQEQKMQGAPITERRKGKPTTDHIQALPPAPHLVLWSEMAVTVWKSETQTLY